MYWAGNLHNRDNPSKTLQGRKLVVFNISGYIATSFNPFVRIPCLLLTVRRTIGELKAAFRMISII